MPYPLPARDNTCAVVVTYHPSAGLPEFIGRIAAQVGHMVIVDNASGPQAQAMLETLAQPGGSIELIVNPTNLGLATGFNQGTRRAIERGYPWAQTFDQDSMVDRDMLETMSAAYRAYPQSECLKIIGAGYRAPAGIPSRSRPVSQAPWTPARDVISSGALVATDAFQQLGPYRDDFFIDAIDSEFCLRARRAGCHVVRTTRPVMEHTLGAPQVHRFLWRAVVVTNHSPFRRYFIARNHFLVACRYAWFDPRYAAFELSTIVFHAATIVLYEKQKGAKLAAMLRGLGDALRGRLGPPRQPPVE